MEFPAAALTRQRALAAAFVAAAAAVGWLERGSATAAHRRSGRPLLAWLETRDGAGAEGLHLAIYHPARRSLAVLHVPEDTRLAGRRTLGSVRGQSLAAAGERDASARGARELAAARLAELSPEPADWSGAGLLSVDAGLPDDETEPPLRAGLALKAGLRSPRAWLRLAGDALRGLARGERSAAEPLLLALELRAVPLERLRPAWLPAGEHESAHLLGRLLSDEEPPAPEGSVTAEILNGAGVDGLASQAAKMLRLKGVDVVTTGASRPRHRTVAYDRVGDFSRAASVLAKLGCREARAVTRLDASRAVDVSVELGRDCARLGGRTGPDPH